MEKCIYERIISLKVAIINNLLHTDQVLVTVQAEKREGLTYQTLSKKDICNIAWKSTKEKFSDPIREPKV